MAWTDLARVKRFLSLPDTIDDQTIQDCIDAAQAVAERWRASSGYPPSVPAPDGACAEGVTRLAALWYQARGTGEGFAGFVDTGATIGTPYYEQRRSIMVLLGCPRPVTDGFESPALPVPPIDDLPPGGLAGDALLKASDDDWDVMWAPVPAPPAQLPPFYFGKAADIDDLPDSYVPVVSMTTPADTPAGVYVFGLSISYVWPTTSRSVYIRWRALTADWNEFVHEPGDATDVVPLVYTFPTSWDGGAFTFELEMSREPGGGGGAPQLDVKYADVWAQQVA